MINAVRLLCLLLLCFQFSHGQSLPAGFEKLDVRLKLMIGSIDRDDSNSQQTLIEPKHGGEIIPIIFKCDTGQADGLITKHGGQLHARVGNIFTGIIPVKNLVSFATEQAVLRIEASAPVTLTNDVAMRQVGADMVQQAKLPNGTPYTGKGVLVGVFDTGIDFAHKDFRKKGDPTQTRIAYVWDQTSSQGKPPATFDYGTEWNNAELNAALGNPYAIDHIDSSGHGTHVSGTAAGLRGIAPDAQLIIVRPNGDDATYTVTKQETKVLIDGLAYIYSKAVELDMPCVVNVSWAYYVGAPHDGTSLVEQAFDQLISQRPGFNICVAVGNENGQLQHFGGYELTKDSTWTYANDLELSALHASFKSVNDDSTFLSVILDSAEFDEVDYYTLSGFKKIYQTPWVSIATIKNSPTALDFTAYFGNGDTAGVIQIAGAKYNEALTEVVLRTFPMPEFTPDGPNSLTARLFKIALKGKGIFHSWWQFGDGAGRYQNPMNFSPPTDSAYRASDDNYVTNILACANNVIAVGAYMGREKYLDRGGNVQYGGNYARDTAGSIARFSCYGPTTDGRIKPDISAPGVNIASTWSRSSRTFSFYVVDNFTVMKSGTSMAAPVTTGAVALYLEKYPTADYTQVRSALTSTAITDMYTIRHGAHPNNAWGYGKVDIFAAMGGVRTVDVDEDKGDHTGLSVISTYPNPASESITFHNTGSANRQSVSIYNSIGMLMGEFVLDGIDHTINVGSWSRGAYYYRVEGNGSSGFWIKD